MSEVTISHADLTDHDVWLSGWAALYRQTPNATFFLSPEWISAWLGGRNPSDRLIGIQAICDGAVVAMGVLSLVSSLKTGVEARLHEFGDHQRDTVYIEYNDFLVGENVHSDIRGKLLSYLDTKFPEVDSFIFRNASPVFQSAAERQDSAEFTHRILLDQPVFICPLEECHSGYLDRLSKSLRTKIRRSIRRYSERGAVELFVAKSEREREEAWRLLVGMHGEAWRRRGQQGVFENEHLIAFHQRLMKNEHQKYELLTLRAGEEPLGVLYNFVHGRTALNYQSGFRYEADNQLAPGFVAHALAAERYLEKEFHTYNLLAGDEDYKKRLGVEALRLRSIVLERRNLRNRLTEGLRGIRSALNP